MAEIETQREDIRALNGVHLFHNAMSNCSQRVRLALCEKGVEYTDHHIELQKNEHLTSEYRALNPNAVVPVLVHDGRTYVESNDIISYIDANFDGPMLIDPEEDANCLIKLSADFQFPLKLVTFEFLMKPMAKRAADGVSKLLTPSDGERRRKFFNDLGSEDGFGERQILDALTEVNSALLSLESALNDSEWLSGREFGLADISWIPNVRRVVTARYPLDRLPKLANWYERIQSRGCFDTAIAAFDSGPVSAFMSIYGRYRALRGNALADYLAKL